MYSTFGSESAPEHETMANRSASVPAQAPDVTIASESGVDVNEGSGATMVRRAVAELPAARLITYADESHLSTLCNHIDEVARALNGPATEIGVAAPAIEP